MVEYPPPRDRPATRAMVVLTVWIFIVATVTTLGWRLVLDAVF